MIGVLGGMGPLATADFFSKVIAATAAARDEDHVPLLIQSDPRVPSRPGAILHGGVSPLPRLMAGRDRLIAGGAEAIVMPCNTAHYWYRQLADDCPVPFLSIVQACCDEAASCVQPGARVGLIATGATLSTGMFSTPLRQRGYEPIVPPDDELACTVLPAIERVKAGFPTEAGAMLAGSVQALLDRGARTVILACTETPLALDAIGSPLRAQCIDSTAALARACVGWWVAHGALQGGS